MKHKIILVVLLMSLLSCSTRQKETYNVINSFLNEKNYLNNTQSDTILIIHQSQPLKEISQYSFNWNLKKPSKDYFPTYNLYWVDSTKTISLNDDTIAHLRNQVNNGEDLIIWNQNKITRLNTIIADSDSIYVKNAKYHESTIKKSVAVYNFTKPIFSKDYTICVFGFYKGINLSKQTSRSNGLMIMKKENDKWIFLGTMRGNEID